MKRILAGAIGAIAICGAVLAAPRTVSTPATVFVVTPGFDGTVSLLPILVVNGAAFAPPPAAGVDGRDNDRFAETFYTRGRTYRLLFGGGDAGSVAVTQDRRDSECGKSTAEGMLTVPADFNRQLSSLATDSASLGRGSRVRRAPTDAERAAAVRLAAEAFAASGARGARTVVNLTALDVHRDGKAELVGTFIMSWAGAAAPARESLFLIAEPDGSGYRAAVSELSRVTPNDLMQGATLETLGNGLATTLVDQIDLDGDGTAEIVATMDSFEGSHYYVYKRGANAWKRVYEFYSYRCAF